MNKTLRNKVLKNASRLITCELNNEDWYSPDGYFATAYPIFDDYKFKKNKVVIGDNNQKPSLTAMLKHADYALAEFETHNGDIVTLSSTADDMQYNVNALYYDFLKHLYPNALPFTAIGGQWHTPVELHDNGVLVAVISPIKQ
jgi:hypothetical protein